MEKLYNVFKNIKFLEEKEIEEIIYEDEILKIIRTVSLNQVTDYYDQDELEIVILLKGVAEIEYDSGDVIELNEGDALEIKPHEVHRVKSQEKAVWLCIFRSCIN
ncbi:cupin domain-containing protein [Peptoniphilus sp. MSJ-1]|uniref:Cupin domain-containing protein n=1 Tax=Peptoniphilus ovalis TaxID=2841503 RepID=A0ABS6FFV9_9FIRM|nr:cupin domain-containing protein [Peptoniphilus ovalis]MBU5668928.1 cupin domain-containing protein [Peptoniphilus ovalis]